MTESSEIAIVGSGFAGSLLARILAVMGYDVVLLERGAHPRFAIGESSTPLANLSLERIGIRYGLADCYQLAAHGRWLESFPNLRRGLKRGFTFYRHHRGESFADRGVDSERLLVAASPDEFVSDSHWLRADVDHHFVREAVGAGVDYRDCVDVTRADVGSDSVQLVGTRRGERFELDAKFLIDASGPGGFLARQLSIPSALDRTETRSAILFSHFAGARPMSDVLPALPEGPYPDDWAAVHHVIDEGWMYSLRFDDGITSAGFLLTPRGLDSLSSRSADADSLWNELLSRYPTISDAFAASKPLMPVAFRGEIQHRLSRAAGDRWVMLPHAYAFVDPLFSTGIAWSLRAVERLALAFDAARDGSRIPTRAAVDRYARALEAEAGQIDLFVAGAYEAMAHFDLFAAQAMLYFATVSFAEASQRLAPGDSPEWNGFMGVGDPALEPLAQESLARLRAITRSSSRTGTSDERNDFARWMARAIAPRNVAGLADPARANLYPVDFDALLDGHHALELTRAEVAARIPALRGKAPPPPVLQAEDAHDGRRLAAGQLRSHSSRAASQNRDDNRQTRKMNGAADA